MHTLYCYVDGSDNQTVEPVLVDAFRALVSDWAQYRAVLVNHQHERTPDMAPDDLSDWFIGLNLPLLHVSRSLIDQLVLFTKALAGVTACDFVVGISSPSGGSEDLVFLNANADASEGSRLYTKLEATLHGA
ncbi:hypothetical protein LRQ11_21120 [Pseudomonas sp. MAFF 311095]|uniref:Uncharacterized protein n=1 Tax=Pseudomonas petroselini TaxID=2899822 RepID=A0ABS8QYN4_9PSED|nr:hypothetical protein [Pseudomonas petroselini]MCD7039542.1 hypothetical protein [Pseudomonas petroselini]MCD7047331.1 hypothetical protein [Pseudomonas petroselini]MCD7069401.1 hypothetical protein [Pseudomonas petroselini]MCD7081186.1 hypothetical protein [Pseudomonas petroselini]